MVEMQQFQDLSHFDCEILKPQGVSVSEPLVEYIKSRISFFQA